MGITIHYKGSLRDAALTAELAEEIADICKSMGWQYETVGKDDVSGIIFQPHPKCEIVELVFDRKGRLINPLVYPDDDPALMVEWVHTKTQFAGPDVHIAVVKLLKYLKRKYLTDLEVEDEGEYWTREDRAYLLNKFAFLNKAIAMVGNLLASSEPPAGKISAEELADRIEELLKKRLPEIKKELGDESQAE
jgi:hypothetical protein